MTSSTHSIVLFHTNSAALKAEKVLQRAGLVVKLVPTPRHLSSDCGVALRCEAAQAQQAQKLLDENSVPYESVHTM
ncbi:MAG TPA: DUF3343 domain-containing protein [Planctomycetota bacterium]|jgi:hypothetical protein